MLKSIDLHVGVKTLYNNNYTLHPGLAMPNCV